MGTKKHTSLLMPHTLEQKRLLSHLISSESLEEKVQKIAERIQQHGDKPHVTVQAQLALLEQIHAFDLGRYLLQHQGVNGYWTHYALTYPWYGKKTGKNNRGESFSVLESFLLNHAPVIRATQQRFQIFLRENQKQVRNHATLASVPCGMLGELLYLDYQNVEQIDLIGIDYDPLALQEAAVLAKQRRLEKQVKWMQQDAWHLDYQEAFDLISSNGLNIYESDDEKVIALYRQFYKALKSGGKLVTSFLTYPPGFLHPCEWDMSKIHPEDVLLQRIIFADIIESKWQCYRTSAQTYMQLKTVGFEDIECIYDDAKIFPTVVAYKK